MLEMQAIREERERIQKGLEKKYVPNAGEKLDQLLELDNTRKEFQAQMNEIQAHANAKAKQIGILMKEGAKAEAEEAKRETGEMKIKVKEIQEKLQKVETEIREILLNLPNAAHERVPEGRTAEENDIVHQHGELLTFPEGEAKPHWELIKDYDLIDFELGVKLTGAGFPVYKGKGAKLQRALVSFFLDRAIDAGYVEVQPPLLINEASGIGTGQLPDKEGQMYHAVADDLYLIPTAEVPITNLYRDVILEEKDLPIKHAGYTPCFRREAGSWGAHVRGLNRLHQFDKVEIVQIVAPEKSYEVLEEMRTYVQGLLEELNIPYRVAMLSGGDISANAALCYDMEIWSAAQERWLEASSISNFETFQANRLQLRYRTKDKKKRLAHTLNGSALALPRLVAAILENNQSAEGIRIPEALVRYCGFDIIEK